MTLWCAGASSWCFLLSKQCRIWKSDSPHTRPTFPRTEGRWCEYTLVLVSLVWSTCRRKAEGRFPQRRGSRCRLYRPLPVALMQELSKITWPDEERNSKQQQGEESFCSFVSWLLLWHWPSVENVDRKTRTAVRMIITRAQLMCVRCGVINFLLVDVF